MALTLVSVHVKVHALFPIENVYADIEDLDVGDLDVDDMRADVPIDFAYDVQRTQRQLAVPKEKDMEQLGAFSDLASEGMHMSMVHFRHELAEEMGMKGTEERAVIWKTMLDMAGVKLQLHVTDPGKILFATRRVEMLERVKEFCLEREETDFFEVKEKKYYAQGRTEPLMPIEERHRREQELGWREKPKPKRRSRRRGGKSGGNP